MSGSNAEELGVEGLIGRAVWVEFTRGNGGDKGIVGGGVFSGGGLTD